MATAFANSNRVDLNKKTQPMHLKGNRLGSANEAAAFVPGKGSKMERDDDALPQPIHDPALTDEERSKQRADRLAAAEARQKKQGGPPKKPKKPDKDAPLVGPNSRNTMVWTSG